MRVALVLTGGVDRTAREKVIPALLSFVERQARRHDLHVYVLRYHDRPCRYPLLGATVEDLGSPRGLVGQYRALVAALRRDGPFDVIHGYWALPAGLVAAAAGRWLRTPSIVTLDSGELVSIPNIGYGLQYQWRQRIAVSASMRLATRLTVCSQYMKRLAEAHAASPEVVPIGVDTNIFRPGRPPEAPPWRLLHVASLNPVKDQSTLVKAVRSLVDRLPEVHLDVVGGDTLGGAIQDLARQMKIDRHITFHGIQPTDRLIPLYQRAHLLVVSSRHEAAGVAVLEAAACGVASVGSAVGYLADWAPHRAVAVEPANPTALADAVADLLLDPAKRDRLAATAREWTLAHNADWTADQFDRVYRELARSSA